MKYIEIRQTCFNPKFSEIFPWNGRLELMLKLSIYIISASHRFVTTRLYTLQQYLTGRKYSYTKMSETN